MIVENLPLTQLIKLRLLTNSNLKKRKMPLTKPKILLLKLTAN